MSEIGNKYPIFLDALYWGVIQVGMRTSPMFQH